MLGLAAPSRAEIYRWTDERGTVHFSDSSEGARPGQGEFKTLNDRLPPPPKQAAIPLEHRNRSYFLQANVNGKTPARLLVDTGASNTMLSGEIARRLGLAVRTDPPVIVQTANGKITTGWARVEELEVGGRRVGPLRVIVHDAVPGADGLLGMDFLGQFRVEIQSEVPALLLNPQ